MLLLGIAYGALQGRIPEVTDGVIQASREAVVLAVSLVGVTGFWAGLMEIAKKAGVIDGLVKRMGPVLRFLFPEVPEDQSGLMFFNTLFDENACCHVAAGAGFSEVLDGFMDMSDEEILAKGVNDSLIHVDFMVGSDDLHIVGIHEDGSETDVFVNGTWAE